MNAILLLKNFYQEKNKQEMFSALKSSLRECASYSSILGLANIERSHFLILKIIWSILVIISVAASIFLVYESIHDYLKYEVVTTIRKKPQVQMEFPAVTICNSNGFASKKGNQFFEENYFETRKNNLKGYSNSLNYDKFYILTMTEFFSRINVYNRNKTTSDRLDLGMNFTDFIAYCAFGLFACKKEDFRLFYSYAYGLCFTFSFELNNIKSTGDSSKFGGLQLMLYLENDQHRSVYNFLNKGAVVLLHQQQKNPFTSPFMSVQPSMANNLVFRKVVTHLEPYPYSNCTKDIENDNSFDRKFYNVFLRENLTYNYQVILFF